jgi:hypothetical protein
MPYCKQVLVKEWVGNNTKEYLDLHMLPINLDKAKLFLEEMFFVIIFTYLK